MRDYTEIIKETNRIDAFAHTIKILEQARAEGVRFIRINDDGTIAEFYDEPPKVAKIKTDNTISPISDFIQFCRAKRDEINSGLCAIGGLVIYFYIVEQNVIDDLICIEGLARDHTMKKYLKIAKKIAGEYMSQMREATRKCNPEIAHHFDNCYKNVTEEIQREFIIAQCTASNELSGLGGKANDHPKISGVILTLLIILNIMRDCRAESKFFAWIELEKTRKNLGYIFERLTGIKIADLQVSSNVHNAMYLMMKKIYDIATIERYEDDFSPIE